MHTRYRLSFCASLFMLVALLSFTLAACGSSTPTNAGSGAPRRPRQVS